MALITNSNVIKLNYIPVDVDRPNDLAPGFIYFDANTGEILINDGIDTRVFGFNQSVLSGYLKNSGDQFLNGILKLPKIRFGNSSAQSVYDAFIVADGYDLEVSARDSVLINSEEGVKIKEPNEGWGSLDIGNGLRIYGNDDTGGNISVSGSQLISFEGAYVTFHKPIYFGDDHNSITWSQSGVEFTAQPGFIFNDPIDMKGNKITNLGEPQSQGDAATMKYVDDEIDSAISRVYKPSGSLNATQLYNLDLNDLDLEGNVYNITTEFTTTDNFHEGKDIIYPAGTNVVLFRYSEQDQFLMIDVLAGFVDLSDYLRTDSTLNAAKLNGTIPTDVKAVTQNATDSTAKIATTAFVKSQGYTTNTGTVTSVGLSLPNIFTVSGGPVTASGSLTASLASQTKGYVFAGPKDNNGIPTFRKLSYRELDDQPTIKIGHKSQDFDGSQAITYDLDDIFNFTTEGIMRRIGDNLYDIDETVYAPRQYVDESILWTVIS